jgi:magnesium transporter
MQVLTSLDEARVAELRARDEFFWLDLTDPSDSDFETLARLLDLSDLALDDLREFKHSRALLHTYGDYMLLVYFAARHLREVAAASSDMLIEVHLLVSGSYIVTLHHRACDVLVELQGRLERNARGTEEFIVFNVLDTLTDSFFPVLSEVGEEIDDLEEEVLQDAREEQLEKSRHVKRELLHFRNTINSQRDLFGRITDEIGELPGLVKDTKDHFRNTYDHLIRLSELVENYRELLTGVRDIYVSTISNRLNEIMKRLTLVATFFLPLTVITSFFGQNFGWLVRNIGSFADFMIFGIGLLVLSVVALWAWFRRSEMLQ